MKIIVLGAGRVGETVAENLASEQNDITVIDQDPVRLAKLRERLDVKIVAGNGLQPSVLRAAGAACTADLMAQRAFTCGSRTASLLDAKFSSPLPSNILQAILDLMGADVAGTLMSHPATPCRPWKTSSQLCFYMCPLDARPV